MTSDPPAARLLVVDDDRVVTELVCHLLQTVGYVPRAAASAAQALELLDAEPFDLVLLDVRLPDQDGFSLCRELKSRPEFQDLPVIFMTGLASEDETLRGFDAGGVDYVAKPFDVRVLLARVKTHTTLTRLARDLRLTLDARNRSLYLAQERIVKLDSQMLLAEERERRRLAEQLHDTTIQQLVLARILLDNMESTSGPEDLNRLRETLDLSLVQLRTLVFELNPPGLHQQGLGPALRWLGERLGACWGLPFGYQQDGEPLPLREDLRLILFQAARELMNNVGRHARARSAEVALAFFSQRLRLTVSDDGVGIGGPNATRETRAGGGFGLPSLHARLELIGGSLELKHREGGGTLAVISVPLDPASLDAAVR